MNRIGQARRDKLIFEDSYSLSNIELAKKYHLSTVRISQIIHTQYKILNAEYEESLKQPESEVKEHENPTA
jgi:Mor family transcriptional regulator